MDFDPDGYLLASKLTAVATGERYGADAHIIYNSDTGRLYYDADGLGGLRSSAFAILDGAPTGIDASDFRSLDFILV